MKSILASDLLKYEIKPFLFGALFSRITIEKDKNHDEYFYFIGYTSFKVSKALLKYDFVKCANELVEKYNNESGNDNWIIHKVNPNAKEQQTAVELRFYIKNNLNLNLATFNNLVYKKLMQCDWLYESGLNENKKAFVRGYMETRGSVDIGRQYITQDYYYNNRTELKRVLVFADHIGIPIAYLNFNPREMQPNSKEKATQFRINIFWYAKEIGFINKYKAQIFANAYASKVAEMISLNDITYSTVFVPKISDEVTFNKMLNFYSNNIFDKKLNSSQIDCLRKEAGFNNRQSDTNKPIRNQSLVAIFDDCEDDKCALCSTAKTYTKPNGRQGFEIHHMIPFHKGKEYDHIGNFVKLCSNCHDSLKKGRASKEQQINNIISILHKKPEVFDYTSAALKENEITILANRIWEMLG